MNAFSEILEARRRERAKIETAKTAGRYSYVLAAYAWLFAKWAGYVVLAGMVAVFWIIAAVLLLPLKGGTK